jgi:sarcosine oxidase subunit gamma
VTDEASARSPLDERPGDLETVGARLLPYLTQIDLRVEPVDAHRVSIPLPLEPNTSSVHDDVEVLWLGPDEWLIVTSPERGSDIVRDLETELADVHPSIVDVSANRIAIELTGHDRFDLLTHVCPLDLEPPAWVAGRCAQTLVGRALALLHERGDATRLFVRPSFAGYVVDLLLEVRRVTGDMRA